MTSIVDRLKKTIDPLAATTAILDATNPVIRLDLQNTQTDYTNCVAEYNEIVNSPSTGNPAQNALRVKLATDKCHAHAVKLLSKYDRVIDDNKSRLEKYQDLFTKAKIAMELSYQTNQINTLNTDKVRKLVISDAVEYPELSRTITLLRVAIKELTDIKAIHNAPVHDELKCPQLDNIVKLYDSRPVYKNKLIEILSGDRSNQYQRIEDIRPIRSKMVAGEAGYNNVTCTAAFKSLCRIVEDLQALYHKWYIESPRYETNTANRVAQCLRSVKNQSFEQDTLDRFVATRVRCERLDKALTMVTDVICPVVLKELSELTNLMEELGAHRHLDADAQLPKEMDSNYSIDKASAVDRELYKFTQGSNKKANAGSLLKRVTYCGSKFGKLLHKQNQLNSKFNRVNKVGVASITQGKNYSDATMLAYMKGWNAAFAHVNLYLGELLDQTNPVSNWNSFQLDIPRYHEFRDSLRMLLESELDIETVQQLGDLAEPVRLHSNLRVSTDKTNIAYSRYNYSDIAVGSEFKKEFDKLAVNCGTTQQLLSVALTEKAEQYALEDEDDAEIKLTAMYSILSTFSNMCNWAEHDINTLLEIYS